MHKVININLSGRIIPMEESAFENLKLYIESLRVHFKDEEGKEEIINDIENRIAELLDQEIKKGSPCITDQKMTDTIKIMGRVEDFIQLEESDNHNKQPEPAQSAQEKTDAPRWSLFRNINDKVVGGVCSGIAHALNIDPVVIRVLFVLFVLGGGAGFILYIILWIVLPKKALEQNIRKKFFRDRDKKVLGGVAAGLAAYFNIPVWIPRLIFLLPILSGLTINLIPYLIIGGGLGTAFFVTYIILWVVVPYAGTTSEKMQMKGEKIDVNSIKNTVKEELNQLKTNVSPTVKATRTTFVSLLLTLLKIFLIFVASIVAFAGMVTAGALTLAAIVTFPLHDFLLSSSLQQWALWGTIVLFLITPMLGMVVWLIRRIVGAKPNKYLSLSFGLLWLLGWISLFILIATVGRDWQSEAVVSTTLQKPANDSSTLVVDLIEPPIEYSDAYDWIHLDESGFDITDDSLFYNNVDIKVVKSDNDQINIKLLKYSRGANKKEALSRAEKITFKVALKDSSLLLGSGIGIDKQSRFRGQRMEVIIALPPGQNIILDDKIKKAYHPIDWEEEEILKDEL
ncbi:MAG: PspC domain-containing protein [Bacteroidetes bacterium]|nr:PspC domain-containing protein [Bacteroidota bacterium]